MFKLFGNKKETIVQTIEKIHGEFDSASEKLLKEAKEILAINKDTGKGDRLKSLGFNKAKPVVESEQARLEKEEKKALAEKIEYYQQWYPLNKFITEKMVEQICEKYGLVCGDVSYYKGDVPEKNITEMENFSLRKEDMSKRQIYSVDEYAYYKQAALMQAAQPSQEQRMLGLDGISQLMRDMRFPKLVPNRDIIYEQLRSEEPEYQYSKQEFKICAPEKDFDMTYLKKNKYKLELNIPDPVVLQPVSGGYLIVSKWGLEASDDLVTNPKQN